MKECISCKESMRQCMDTHTFALRTYIMMRKRWICISMTAMKSTTRFRRKQFLIDNYFYDISDGDIFLINQFESII